MPTEVNHGKSRAASPAGATRVAIYTRVSTDDQVEGTSLEHQRARCEQYVADRDGFALAESYVDGGESGSRASRPALDRMMAAVDAGAIDVVVVWKLDRLGRSVRHLENLLHELEDAGVAFVSVGDGLDYSTPAGRAMRQVQAVFAEMERSLILERTTAGLRSRATEGFWPGGPAPYGFRLDRDGGRTRLAIHESEAEVLRRAAAMLIDEGLTSWTAAEALNKLGMTPRKGPRWVHNRLRRVMQSSTLNGEWTYGRGDSAIRVEIPRILEPDRYAALQDVLTATSITTPRKKGRYYLLSKGRLLGRCGGSYGGVWRVERESRVYRCVNSRPEADPRCLDHNINADMAEEIVWGEVVALLSDPKRLVRLADEYARLQAAQVEHRGDDLETVQAKLADVKRARTRALVDGSKAGLPPELLKSADDDLAAQERQLLDSLARLQEQTGSDDAPAHGREVMQLARAGRDRLDALAPQERREVLDLLDVRATVTGWTKCGTCLGKGRVRGGTGGNACPACRALRHVPSFRIEGVVLDAYGLDASSGPVPFTLETAGPTRDLAITGRPITTGGRP